MNQRVLVIGGTGKTGRLVVQKLQREKIAVIVMTRNESKAKKLFGDTVEIVSGDLVEDKDFKKAVDGISHIIATQGADGYPGKNGAERIDYRGIEKITKSIASASNTHFILMSAIYVTRKNHPMNQPGEPIYWKGKGEKVVRESGLPFTIVRASWLTNEKSDGLSIRGEQGDTGDGEISREAVAEVLVQAVLHESSVGKVMELFEGKKKINSWEGTFEGLA